MQEMDPEVIENTAVGVSAQLRDTRDDKTYWVTKLKDGNIWMTQNLDYDLSVAANQTLTLATSDVVTTRIVTPINSDLATFSTDYNSDYYLDGGDYYMNGATKTEGYSSLPADSVDRHYAQGDYYSWKAATAGVGTTSIANADVNESICPKGWRLPTSNSDSANYSFGNLVKQYSYSGSNQDDTTDSALLSSPLFFARSGRAYSGSLYYQGNSGSYWSSEAHSNNNYAYDLDFNGSHTSPSGNGSRHNGFNVRCVARKEKSMQDVANWKNTLGLEQQVQVRDDRDGKIYWAAKLKDGNIWMTQNLDYDLSVTANQTLTPATSNVTENRTVTPANSDLATFSTDANAIYYLDGGDYYYANGTTKTEGYSSLSVDSTDRHYAQGDYYSWKAATAGQGDINTINVNASESICPAGWRLPTSNSDSANYSFGKLAVQYGYSSGGYQSTPDSTLRTSPLFFVRGGYIHSSSLDDQGNYGNYWTSMTFSDNGAAYNLNLSSSYIHPSNGNGYHYGFSVRCVAL